MRADPVGFPTPAEAERMRSPEHIYAQGVLSLGRDLAWLVRHSGASVEEAWGDVETLCSGALAQETVWAVSIAPCVCGENGSVGVMEWRVSEGLRDRAANELLMNDAVSPGDVMSWWTIALPTPMREMTDDQVTEWCDLVVNDDEPTGSKRHGECPACGRTDGPIGGEEAVRRLMESALTEVDPAAFESRIRAVLRSAGVPFAREGDRHKD